LLQETTTEFVIYLSLIFARLGTALHLFPAISSVYILMRGRLILAIATSLVLYPVLYEHFPKYPFSTGAYITYLVIEIMIGIVISIAAKICFQALDIVGAIISMQSGLSAAMFFDPNHKTQISLISNFLFMMGYAAIFATDTHYLFLQGIVDSYSVFKVGILPDTGDLSHFISTTVNQSFILAFKLVSPFIAVSLGFLISNGVLSRLMPNLQVFFVVTPAQIWVMFVVLFIVVNFILAKLIEAVRVAIKMGSFV